MNILNTAEVDILEIVFEKKNKEYGAFQLRKKYKFILSLSLWCAILAFILITSSPLIYESLKKNNEMKIDRSKVIQITELAEPPSIGEKKDLSQIEAAPPPLKSTIKFMPPVVKPDEQVTDEYIPTVDELKAVDPGTSTQQGTEGGVDYSLIEAVETKEEEIVEEKEAPFTFVEEMPVFPGGQEELMGFIVKNVQYPEVARKAGIEGRVYIRFVVEKEGTPTNFELVKGIGAGCDEEAVRVCKLMPRWLPGKQNGKSVRVSIVIPFIFRLK